MSKLLRSKWALLAAGASLMTLQLGQCIGDFLQDAIIFRWVN
jgi:hypothetical protein